MFLIFVKWFRWRDFYFVFRDFKVRNYSDNNWSDGAMTYKWYGWKEGGDEEEGPHKLLYSVALWRNCLLGGLVLCKVLNDTTHAGARAHAKPHGPCSAKPWPPSMQFFINPDWKLLPTYPMQLKKNALAFLKAVLSTKHILSALHLQGPKSNMYVHFLIVNKQLIGILFPTKTYILRHTY